MGHLLETGLRCFDNDASPPAAKTLTVNFAGSDGGVIGRLDGTNVYIKEADTLLLTFSISGLLMSSFHVRVIPSPDGGATERGALPSINYITGGEIDTGSGEWKRNAPVVGKNISFIIPALPGFSYIIECKRTGGDATSAVLGIVDILRA